MVALQELTKEAELVFKTTLDNFIFLLINGFIILLYKKFSSKNFLVLGRLSGELFQ